MREEITAEVSAAERARLEAIVADRNSPQKHVWRARIVLLTADGFGDQRDHAPGGHRHRVLLTKGCDARAQWRLV